MENICGNGILESSESCDKGVENSNTRADACRETCVISSCGDRVTDTGEACDEGYPTNECGINCQCRPGYNSNNNGCEVVACGKNERVSANRCVACPPGTTNSAGDQANESDTTCDITVCEGGYHVTANRCVACPPGTTNIAGDQANEPDTTCDITLCEEDYRVSANGCEACPPGTTNTAGDPANGSDTSCVCPASPYPANHSPNELLDPEKSIAMVWNEILLEAIKLDLPRPTVHARNLFHLSALMWDIWAAYQNDVTPFLLSETAPEGDLITGVHEAISYAAYRLLNSRFANSTGASFTTYNLCKLMTNLDYDPSYTATNQDTPASFGNLMARKMIDFGLTDGSNESEDYADNSGYQPVNPPLDVILPGTTLPYPNRWQPLTVGSFITQNDIELGETPSFVGPHWGEVSAFVVSKENPADCIVDPGEPPLLGHGDNQEYMNAFIEVIALSSLLDPAAGGTMDISPASLGNNNLGENDGTGHPLNPMTGQPYSPQVVNTGDYGRVVAEFWADGPDSETPPGHWNTLANYVSTHPQVARKFQGEGPEIPPLEWDLMLYFVLNGALHDAAIAAWDSKSHYDYVRPISAIRHMGGLGQSTDMFSPRFNEHGLPLLDGLVEFITSQTTARNGRHRHLKRFKGEIAVYAWRGAPSNESEDVSGVGWIRAKEWVPYQRPSFVTPPFASYVSGHSTFSRAAAEVLTAFTGSSFFPGGLGEFAVEKNKYLKFEKGPSQNLTLQWATYFDASDQSGLSRLYGGIHIAADDKQGRLIGATVGQMAFQKALTYFEKRP